MKSRQDEDELDPPMPAPDRLSYRGLQRLLAAAFIVHDAEEAMTARRYLPRVAMFLQEHPALGDRVRLPGLGQVYVALAIVTLGPVLAIGWATTGREDARKQYVVALLAASLFWNVFLPHVPAAIAFGGYSPGVATAVVINLPFALYFFRRSLLEGHLSPRALTGVLVGGLVPLAIVPLLLL
jgi:hypothetical protein